LARWEKEREKASFNLILTKIFQIGAEEEGGRSRQVRWPPSPQEKKTEGLRDHAAWETGERKGLKIQYHRL